MSSHSTSLEPKSQLTINLALGRKHKKKENSQSKKGRKHKKERKFPIKRGRESKKRRKEPHGDILKKQHTKYGIPKVFFLSRDREMMVSW